MTIVLLAKSIYDHSHLPMVTFMLVLVPFFLLGLSQVRQGLSLAFIVYSYTFVKNRQLIPFLGILVLASGFHFSALFFLPIYFLAHKKISLKFTVISIFAFLLLESVGGFGRLMKLSAYTFEHIHYKFLAYYEPDSPLSISTVSFYWRILVLALASFVHYKRDDNDDLLLRNIYWIGILYYIMFSATPTIVSRASLCCKIFEIFIISNSIDYFWKEHKRVFSILVFSLSILYFSRQMYYHATNEEMCHLIEYKTIFTKNQPIIE